MMSDARIVRIECAVPKRLVTNEELSQLHPGWKMEQVVLHTGVKNRYWCEPGETALDLAEKACARLQEATGDHLRDVDFLLFCTESQDHPMPPNACLLQDRLGLPHSVAAMDYNLACSGFIYGLFLARALIGSGSAQKLLLVTADTYSRWMNREDRGPATLFGDGAAATLIQAGGPGIGNFLLATDGGRSKCVYVPAGGMRQPSTPETREVQVDNYGNRRTAENLYMDGARLLEFVKQEIPKMVKALMKRENVGMEDLDLVVFHPGSKLVLDYLYRVLDIPESKQFDNLEQVGNTSSASIPIALREAEARGRLKPGMKVLLAGFGVGLSWGACMVDW
jgi:3-oxoacyl-[acyl-carrier-protein] synthase-3